MTGNVGGGSDCLARNERVWVGVANVRTFRRSPPDTGRDHILAAPGERWNQARRTPPGHGSATALTPRPPACLPIGLLPPRDEFGDQRQAQHTPAPTSAVAATAAPRCAGPIDVIGR
jgi:hypothetical protein